MYIVCDGTVLEVQCKCSFTCTCSSSCVETFNKNKCSNICSRVETKLSLLTKYEM